MLDANLDELTAIAAPTLRAINGVGPQVAAALLAAAGDNPDRLRSSASFAALCGASPIDASSGRQQRHRLNRGGDRQANCALYYVIISRLRWHQPTKTYMARRIAQGRTTEVIPLLQALPRPRSPPSHHHRPQRLTTTSNDRHESQLDIQRSFGSPTMCASC